MILRNLLIRNRDVPVNIKVNGNNIADISDVNDFDSMEAAIDFSGCIAFPGLINSHDHLEFNLYPKLGHKIYEDYVEWGDDIHEKDKRIISEIQAVQFAERIKAGILKNLTAGVTHVAHHGEVYIPQKSPIEILQDCTNIHSVRLDKKWKFELIYPTNLEPYVFHVGEGVNEQSHKEIDELIKWNLFRRKIFGVHAIAMDREQSSNFEAIIWCPDSNHFLFGKTADIKNLKKHTVILFGTDSTLTSDWNIWHQIRNARESELLSDDELMDSLTARAADTWKVNAGRIESGKYADLVIVPNKENNFTESFFSTNPEDIILILKGGSVVMYDESFDPGKIDADPGMFNQVVVRGRKKFVRLDAKSLKGLINKVHEDIIVM